MRPALRRPVATVSEPGDATRGASSNGAAPAKAKAGRHREATLYRALAGAGAGDGRSLEQLRADAREAFNRLELPVWRRSGFRPHDWHAGIYGPGTPLRAAAGRLRSRLRGRHRPGRRATHAPRPALRRAHRAERRHGGPGRARSCARRAGSDPVLAGGRLPRARRASRAVVLQAPDDRPPQVRGGQRGLLERRGIPVRSARPGRRRAL